VYIKWLVILKINIFIEYYESQHGIIYINYYRRAQEFYMGCAMKEIWPLSFI
jgi:hypothetical protein